MLRNLNYRFYMWIGMKADSIGAKTGDTVAGLDWLTEERKIWEITKGKCSRKKPTTWVLVVLAFVSLILAVVLTGCDLASVAEVLDETSEALTVAEKNLWPVAKSSWDAYSERHPEFQTLEFPDGIVTVKVPAIKPEWYHKKPYPKPTPRPIPRPTPKPGSFADSENSHLFDDIWCEPSELVNNAYEDVYVDIVDVRVDTMDELVDEPAECPGAEDGEDWDYYGEIPGSYYGEIPEGYF